MEVSSEEGEIPIPIPIPIPINTNSGSNGHGIHNHHHHHNGAAMEVDDEINEDEDEDDELGGCNTITNNNTTTLTYGGMGSWWNNSNSNSNNKRRKNEESGGGVNVIKYRYRECQKNHAASMGGNARDGCGEFMPSGQHGSLEALTCSACQCHRNFHRKQPIPAAPLPHNMILPSTMIIPTTRPLHQHQHQPQPPHNKRFRTKFTHDQKMKMLAFAHRVGWKLQKQQDSQVQQFCQEIGVKRRVLKVWMHNNKHNLATPSPSSATIN